MKKIIPILLLCVFPHINAAELFGINLTGATQDQLRVAVKQAGLKLVLEAGVDTFYDIYKGDSVLYKANHLYLGFVKKDKKFAFAEYEFNGLEQHAMLQKLHDKYGLVSPSKGKFMTDLSYSWVSEGTVITFYQDWNAYKTRLTYYNPEALKQLRIEQKQFQLSSSQQKAVYLEAAY